MYCLTHNHEMASTPTVVEQTVGGVSISKTYGTLHGGSGCGCSVFDGSGTTVTPGAVTPAQYAAITATATIAS